MITIPIARASRAPEGPSNLMHRWSQLFIPTLREPPADAEVASHKLLLRAGYIRQLGAGVYSFLFLGNRSLHKITRIIREEMDRIGQEFLLPSLHPRELWEESGRWTAMGDNMFRLKDRKGADLCLGMTHEEVMTSIARAELRSYKQLPQIWYQIQTKFRDEPRPKSGLLRVRQFLMKDSYSFDIDDAGLDLSYRKHDEAYRRIFTRCGLQFVAVEADSGSMGGSQSQEFMVYTEAGEDLIASSPSGYAANLEKATSVLTPVEDLSPTGNGLPELVPTPGKASIADVTAFFGIHASQDIKCVAFIGTRANASAAEPPRPIVAFLRGDHFVNETKLNAIAGTAELRPMTLEELALHIGGPAGFLGPIGIPQVMTQGSLNGLNSGKDLLKLKGVLRDDAAAQHLAQTLKTIVIMDRGLEGRHNLVAGANQLDMHFRNVTPGRDFTPTLAADIRNILEGELDPIGRQPLRLGKAVEIGHIFKLGRKYTTSMGASVLNRDGKETTPTMGSYGIGVERILTAAIEQSAAANQSTSAALNVAETYALPPRHRPLRGRSHRHQHQGPHPPRRRRTGSRSVRASRLRRPPRRPRRTRRSQVQGRRTHRHPLPHQHRPGRSRRHRRTRRPPSRTEPPPSPPPKPPTTSAPPSPPPFNLCRSPFGCRCPFGCCPFGCSPLVVAPLVVAPLVVIPEGNLLLPLSLPLPFGCHSRRESASALVFAVAPLVVIPEGNLLLPLSLPLPLWLSFPKGICCPPLSLPLPLWLSFPKGICFCPCLCRYPSGCHSRRESASALVFAVAPLVVIPEGNLLLPLSLPLPLWLSFPKGICFCPCLCRCPSDCHSQRESASTLVAFAVAPLIVIPKGNLLPPLSLPLPLWLSFPKGICFRPCLCRCPFGCHSRRESAVRPKSLGGRRQRQPSRTFVACRTPPLMNVSAVRTMDVTAPRATKLIDHLNMVGPSQTRIPDHNLLISIEKPGNCRRGGCPHGITLLIAHALRIHHHAAAARNQARQKLPRPASFTR